MQRMQTAMLVSILSAALSVLSLASAQGQEATPAAFPTTPDPAACSAEAQRGADATPAGEMVAASPVIGASQVQSSTPIAADPATVAAIEATVNELFACFNAGDQSGALALVADPLRQQVRSQGPTGGAEAPTPLPEQNRMTVVDVTEVRMEADGSVVAVVESRDPTRSGSPEEMSTEEVRFVQKGDEWLVAETTGDEDVCGGICRNLTQ